MMIFSLLLTAALGPGVAAQSNPAPHSHQKSSLPFRSPPPAVAQEQFLPYWTTEVGWSSEIQLRNNQLSGDLTVTPFLRSTDGTETALQPVIIGPKNVATVHIDAAISGVAPQLVNTYGSVVLRYKAPSVAVLWAMAMIHGVGHPFAFHLDPSIQLSTYTAGSREGIWWLPLDSTSDYLILTNMGADPLALTLAIYDSSGKEFDQPVTLAPRAMNRYSVRQLAAAGGLTGSYGGVKVSAAAHAGSLSTLHFLFDQNAGFAALLKMFDHDPTTQLAERDFAHTGLWTLRAPMLPLASPDPALGFPPGIVLQPRVFIRNTTANPVDAAVSFGWRNTAATGKAAGPSLHLGPYQTVRLDVGALQNASLLPQNANWTSVTLVSSGPPEGLMAVAASFDPTFAFGAQTPFSDQLAFHWVGSLWEYDAQHDSLITVGNGGTKPALADFILYYNPGAQQYEMQQTLQPGDQMWVDVGKLIREHIPDKNGNVLPATVSSGTYEIQDLTNTSTGALFEGKIVFDKTYGYAAYGCAGCCGVRQNTIAFLFDPLDIPLGYLEEQFVQGYQPCSNSYIDVSDAFYNNWSTADTSIATVDNYGNHTGMGTGSTTSQTSGLLQIYETGAKCPNGGAQPSGNLNVKPTISGPNTLWWFAGISVSGYANQITLTAAGSGSSYQWAITNGASKVSLSTTTSATVQVTSTGQSTAANDVSVTVTVGGQTSDPYKLTVRAPYSFGADPSHPVPIYSQDSTYVWNILIFNTVLDNFGSPMSPPVEVNESWTTAVASDYAGQNWRRGDPACAPTSSSGTIADLIGGETPDRTPTPVYNTQQNGAAVQHWGQDYRVGACLTSAPRVQSDTLQKYIDHAAHTGIVSPAP